ncbi:MULTISPECIES: DoxX family protein [Halobacterium]|uniref:DoxX family protein n=1 Tax=Halobacterium TaxID=2239 RepID=UPI0019633728|nr:MULTISPECIES: DoxX family protein [Halobacterium]MCF2165273.1 DoxX family protein [Halobacterium salinarum]MCF2167918.1 DoxX family protein [Halobacterium salinarum]MCF2239442.1 DoxX family protein [Halobacterium salinarum]QRY21822.1 DoxX family protein [Halobacterium sp. GSL-19]WJK63230.1 DoxX family protein [Halobacterium salinarum]
MPPVAPASPGHVRYVSDGAPTDRAIAFLVDVLSTPLNAAIVAAGAAAVVTILVVAVRYQPAATDVHALRDALAGYHTFMPWMLRLAVGLPLIGAGFTGYFISPAVQSPTRVFQVTIGFLLLFGLATRAVALVGLTAYLAELVVHPELVLASEYVGGFLGIALLGSGRPSADHLLQRVAAADGSLYGRLDPLHPVVDRFNDLIRPFERYAPTVIRAGLGFNFALLGFWEKLAHPGRALAVVEKYELTTVVPVDPGLWVLGAGATELAVGVLFVLGLFTRATAATAFLVLTTTLFGLPDDPVLAHVTLFGMVSALFVTGGGPLSLDRVLDAWDDRTATPQPAARGDDAGS